MDVDPSIIAAASLRRLLITGVVRFTDEAADRLEADHAGFREDHSHGGFDSIDMICR